MNRSSRFSFVWVLLLPVVLTLSLSGCTGLGAGAAAAGASVGGCALLDANEDDTVTAEEVSEGLFNNWDADQDGVLSEKEFDVGAQATGVFTDRPGGFDAWDTDDDDELSKDEFEAGVADPSSAAQWADATCDELGM